MFVKALDFMGAYNSLLKALHEQGVEAQPRGRVVQEFRHPVMWTISNHTNWVPGIKGRRLNIFFALAEVVWMWSGNGSVDYIAFYNESIRQFQDGDLRYFNAAYGKRVRHAGYKEDPLVRPEMPWTTRYIQGPDGSYGLYAGEEIVEVDQIQAVIKKLSDDPETRQAVISLWDPIKDNLIVGSKDYPCNNLVMLSIRPHPALDHPQLNMTVVMRSNDIILGTPYNMIQFSHLHALLSGSLGVEMGDYNVVVNNLHMYREDYYPPFVRDLINSWKWSIRGNDKALFWGKGDPNWEMRWTIDQFDEFLHTVWLPIESDMRLRITEGRFNPHTVLAILEGLEEHFSLYGVPTYWQQIFKMLVIWCVRKSKIPESQAITSEMLESVNPWFKALALDFDPNLQEA